MSWRTGGKLFTEIWPAIQANISDQNERIELTGELLKLFIALDMDPWDVEDIHADVRSAMRKIGVRVREPERYTD
jgi:hypothetical protein